MPAAVDSGAVRMQILEAFERCITQKPLTQISLRDIAAEAGMSHVNVLYYFKDKVLDSLQSCGWFEHTDLTHVLTSETFRSYCDLNFIARNDFCVNHSRCIVPCVSTAYRVFYYRFS